jgi:hypothetical protein
LLNAPMKQLLRVATIPILDQRTHALGLARSRRAYMQISADQFHGVAVTQVELKPVLPAKEDVGFSAHISPFGKRWGGLAKVLQLPSDPRCTTLNACLDLCQARAFGRVHFDCQVRAHADGQTLGFGTYQAERNRLTVVLDCRAS